MKKIVVLVALIASLLTPASANAAETKFTGAPLTNLDSQGATVNIMLLGVPAKGGLYVQQCVQAPVGTRSALCNKAVELWISYSRGASFLPTDVIKFKPARNFVVGETTVDCTVSNCGIFMCYDHTVPGDLSEDQFIPLTFNAASSTAAVLTADEITATINGVSVSTKAPITLGYRQLSTVAATSKAGATLTFASLAPECALVEKKITPLKGSGECAISVTSAGNSTASGVTAILPIYLTLGEQSIPKIAAKNSISLVSKSNFGQKVSYKVSGNCSLKKNTVKAKKGNCAIVATAAGVEGLFEAMKSKVVLKIK